MTLLQMRLESDYKMKKLEKVLGVGRRQVYNLEKGVHKLSPSKIKKLSALYNVSEEEIVKAWEEGKAAEDSKRKIVQAV